MPLYALRMNSTKVVCLAALTVLWSGFAYGQTSMTFGTTGPNLAMPGAPFEAVRVTKTVLIQADGSTIEHLTQEHLYRDSQGRVLDEYKKLTGENSGTNASVLIDPVTGRTQNWSSKNQSGLQQSFKAGAHVSLTVLPEDHGAESRDFIKAKTTTTTEDLGKKTIAGIEVTGKRTVKTLPANSIGNSKELKETQEVWTSDELQLVMEEKDRGPVTGIRTIKTISLQRGEPAAKLFKMTGDATLKPFAGVPGSILSSSLLQNSAYAKAMEGLKAADSRDQAGATLVEYAKEHPETETHVAFLLALYGTHLDEAEALGRASVKRMEDEAASGTSRRMTVGDVKRMVYLAQAWDALGWALWKKGEKDEARRYCAMSWSLGGEGASVWHLATMSKDAGQDEIAKHQLQLALGGRINDAETQEIKKELVKMGVADPYPLHEPTVIMLSSQTSGKKVGMYWLEFAGRDKPKVSFVTGDDALALMGTTIASADFPRQLPDDGPEHVLRRGVMVCDDVHCKLTLSYAADIQPRPKLSEPSAPAAQPGDAH